MNSISAFIRGEAATAAGNKEKVFDWEKAARLIAEIRPKEASAGLSEDWEYTGGEIWAHDKPVPKDQTYVYLCSNWATPELSMDGSVQPCWRYEDETPGWGSETYWPPEAMAILGLETPTESEEN